MNLLMKIRPKKYSREAAARKVARAIASWPVAETSNFNWKTVKNWRDRFSSGMARDDYGANFYVAANEFIERIKDSIAPLENVAENILRNRPPWLPKKSN